MSHVLHTRVYRRTRRSHGKPVTVYRGYFTLQKNGPRYWKSLGTPDRAIAEKRIMEMALEAQRVQEGLAPSPAQRDGAAKGLLKMSEEYERDLASRGLATKHIHDTLRRVRRVLAEAGWRSVSDVRADSFVAWRSSLTCSAKTKKEYQISVNAFLNWMQRNDRIASNLLARVDKVETRGKQVRQYRAFTEEELSRLLSVSGKRRLAYLTLLYTGQRKSEVRALVWGDLHLDSERPHALFREGTTKDKDKRPVALRKELAEELRAARPDAVDPTKRVFWWCWPTYDLLMGDLKRAGIERKDGLGRVLHFHSFRKTWQSLGVRYGVNQRAAQEILGHSDANLTAKAYTDVPSLELHGEIAKFPWITPGGAVAQHGAQNTGVPGQVVSLADVLRIINEMSQATGTDGVGRLMALAGTPCQSSGVAARAGIEPVTK